jgi:hypothetical protein
MSVQRTPLVQFKPGDYWNGLIGGRLSESKPKGDKKTNPLSPVKAGLCA